MNRRGFFRLLGLSPLAAKVTADKAIADLTINAAGLAPSAIFGHAMPQAAAEYADYKKAAAYLKAFGIPEYILNEMRRSSTYVSCLDPDLAALKSFSMSVKIMTQRERNFQKSIEQQKHSFWYSAAEETFSKVTGWKWPW